MYYIILAINTKELEIKVQKEKNNYPTATCLGGPFVYDGKICQAMEI